MLCLAAAARWRLGPGERFHTMDIQMKNLVSIGVRLCKEVSLMRKCFFCSWFTSYAMPIKANTPVVHAKQYAVVYKAVQIGGAKACFRLSTKFTQTLISISNGRRRLIKRLCFMACTWRPDFHLLQNNQAFSQ
jgi:hypothetical protein